MDEFEKQRILREQQLHAKMRKESERLKQNRAELMKPWIDDGKRSFSALTSNFNNVASILRPHKLKKAAIQELLQANTIIQGSSFKQEKKNNSSYFYCSFYSTKLLNSICFKHRYRLITNKSFLWYWKTAVLMVELRRFTRKLWIYELPSKISVVQVLQLAYRIHKKFMIVDPDILHDYTRKKQLLFDSQKHLNQLEVYISKCENVLTCKALYHLHAAGCPYCHVIHIGANMVRYIKRIHRETGLETLVTLDFEMECLDMEKKDQMLIIENARLRLQECEDNVYNLVRVRMQTWWNVISSLTKAKRQETRLERSLYYFRLRRLSKLKHILDLENKNSNSIVLDLNSSSSSTVRNQYTVTFSDLRPEIDEYSTYLTKKKAANVHRQAVTFLQKLRTCVARTRQRCLHDTQRQHALQAMHEAKLCESRRRKELKEARTRLCLLEARRSTWVCLRPECAYRAFMSQDRYETHMKTHEDRDVHKREHRQVIADTFNKNITEETTFLTRVLSSKAHLNTFDKSSSSSSSSCVLQLPDINSNDTNPPHHMHMHKLHTALQGQLYHLELMSRHSDISVPFKVPLDVPVLRIGTSCTCECSVLVKPNSQISRDARIARIHCLIYCSSAGTTVVDNSSAYGTYVVNARGAFKVPGKLACTLGWTLSPGDLLAVGVKERGPETLTAVEANEACFVFRVRCLNIEQQN